MLILTMILQDVVCVLRYFLRYTKCPLHTENQVFNNLLQKRKQLLHTEKKTLKLCLKLQQNQHYVNTLAANDNCMSLFPITVLQHLAADGHNPNKQDTLQRGRINMLQESTPA